MTIKLGTPVRDLLSGFTGVVSARTEYLDPTRHAQILVSTGHLDVRIEHWFDEPRLTLDGEVPAIMHAEACE